MKSEERMIKASLMAGISDIVTGLILYKLGWLEWYNSHFHMFGVLGMGLVFYAYWHLYFYKRENNNNKIKW